MDSMSLWIGQRRRASIMATAELDTSGGRQVIFDCRGVGTSSNWNVADGAAGAIAGRVAT